MADDFETTRETRSGGTTTVIHETRGSSGAGWMIALVLLFALVAGVWYLTQANHRQATRDNAVSAAAAKVGAAAETVGSAAQDAANDTKR